MLHAAEPVRAAPLFEQVAPDLVEAVLQSGSTRALAASDRLLRSGDENDQLFLILSGRLGMFVASRTEPYLQLGPGASVGELSMIDPSAVSADVIALEPTTVLALPRHSVQALIEASARAAQNLLRILIGRMRHANVALAMAEFEIEEAATTDAITGLRNRRWLDSAFEQQLFQARRNRQHVSLLVIDLDNFKQVNETHGHAVGDAVLAQVARCLGGALRPQELIVRYGGDEFAVLLPNIDAAQAVSVAERLRVLVQTTLHTLEAPDTPGLVVTVTIGVAEARDHGGLADWLKAADRALYRAKHAGRNRVSL